MNAYAKLLKSHPLFSTLSPKTLDQLASRATLVKYPKSSVIYKGGDNPDALYVIITGRCQSHIVLPGGAEHILDIYAPGDTFGERALLSCDKHWTTVKVITDSVLLRIDGADVQTMLDQDPLLARQLARQMRKQLESIRGEISNDSMRPKLGRVAGIFSLSRVLRSAVIAENLAVALQQITGQQVLLVHVQAGNDQPSLAKWHERVPEIDVAFALKNELSVMAGGAHKVSLYICGDAHETENIASFIGHTAHHYRFVLLHLNPELPSTLVNEFILQSDASYFLLCQREDELYRANMLFKHLRELPAGPIVKMHPVVCLDNEEQAHPGETLSGQIGQEVQSYIRGFPSGHETASPHYLRAPQDQFSYHVRHLAREIGRCRMGLALSSGGAKGLAHIGVIQVLEENNIEVDVVTGSSMGAFIGALWNFGISGKDMEKMAHEFENKRRLLRVFDPLLPPRRGFMRGEGVKRLLQSVIGHVHFPDLLRPLRVLATDFDTLERVVFDSGEVADAVHASMAMPGIIIPVQLNGRTLIDGGVADPLPVDVLIEMEIDKIIAVNTIPNPDELRARLRIVRESSHIQKRASWFDRHFNYFATGNILDIISRSVQGAAMRVAEGASAQADVTLRPIAYDGKWSDFRNPKKYIQLGRRVAEEKIDEIRALAKGSI